MSPEFKPPAHLDPLVAPPLAAALSSTTSNDLYLLSSSDIELTSATIGKISNTWSCTICCSEHRKQEKIRNLNFILRRRNIHRISLFEFIFSFVVTKQPLASPTDIIWCKSVSSQRITIVMNMCRNSNKKYLQLCFKLDLKSANWWIIGHVSNIPTTQFSLEFWEILNQNLICYHWLSVSGISKIMHCGILINMPYSG